MKEAADHIHAISKRITVYECKRKQDEAMRLQALWQRWEISNFDYLMKASARTVYQPSAGASQLLERYSQCSHIRDFDEIKGLVVGQGHDVPLMTF